MEPAPVVFQCHLPPSLINMKGINTVIVWPTNNSLFSYTPFSSPQALSSQYAEELEKSQCIT